MSRRLIFALLAASLVAVALSGCGPDPKEAYAEKASAIIERWQDIVLKWNNKPGDPKVATAFAVLQAEAKAIDPPPDMRSMHSLLLQSIEVEAQSFELYAAGKKDQSLILHSMALDSAEKYKKALQNLGLVE